MSPGRHLGVAEPFRRGHAPPLVAGSGPMLFQRDTRRVLLAMAACFIGSAAHAQTSRIVGTVTDTLGARPLPGVEVTVTGAGGRTVAGVRTDAAGRYTAGGLAAGRFQVRTRLIGYAAKEASVTVSDGETKTI